MTPQSPKPHRSCASEMRCQDLAYIYLWHATYRARSGRHFGSPPPARLLHRRCSRKPMACLPLLLPPCPCQPCAWLMDLATFSLVQQAAGSIMATPSADKCLWRAYLRKRAGAEIASLVLAGQAARFSASTRSSRCRNQEVEEVVCREVDRQSDVTRPVVPGTIDHFVVCRDALPQIHLQPGFFGI